MFSCRLLFRHNFITTDKLSASCKFSVSGKPPNVIKIFNTENKSLFGRLLESRAQRRKNVSKATNNPNLSLVTKTSAKTDLEALVQNEAPKKKTRSKKTKEVETLSVSSDNSVTGSSPNNNSCDSKSDVSNQSLNEFNSRKSKVSRSTKESLNNTALVNSQNSTNDESSTVLSDNFFSKSAVPVNEDSYPLDNPDKSPLSIQSSCSSENILNYGFTDPLVKGYLSFPSVSKIMEDTMSPTSRLVLGKWRKNMVAELGEEGFAKHCTGLMSTPEKLYRGYSRLPFITSDRLRKKKSQNKIKTLKERGHEFHEAVRNAVLGRSSEVSHSDITCNALRSLEWVLRLVSSPLAVESIIAHPHLQYKGIPDCVAMFRGVPVVIDWKLSEKPKKHLKDTYDAPVQITAYMGALNHDPNYKWKVSFGLVAVAYTSGDPSDVFMLNPSHCKIYWRHWLLRCHKFNTRNHLHVDHQIDEKALESV